MHRVTIAPKLLKSILFLSAKSVRLKLGQLCVDFEECLAYLHTLEFNSDGFDRVKNSFVDFGT